MVDHVGNSLQRFLNVWLVLVDRPGRVDPLVVSGVANWANVSSSLVTTTDNYDDLTDGIFVRARLEEGGHPLRRVTLRYRIFQFRLHAWEARSLFGTVTMPTVT